MVEQQISRLKNVIFLKLLVYLVIIAFLLWLIPIFQYEQTVTISKNQDAKAKLFDMEGRLSSLQKNPKLVDAAYRKFEEIMLEPISMPCILRLRMKHDIEALDDKYNLANNITVNIAASSIVNKADDKDFASLRTTDIELKLATASIEHVIDVSNAAFAILPEYSYINKMVIQKSKVLDPTMLSNIQLGKEPGVFSGVVQMKMQEIKLKKFSKND